MKDHDEVFYHHIKYELTKNEEKPLAMALGAYYRMNDGSGTTITDNSSNSNNGTMTNMDCSSDWVSNTLFGQDYALDFDGSNDYVIVSDDNSLDNDNYITISMWINAESITNKDCLISKRSSTEQSGNYALRFNSSKQLKWYIWGGDADNGSTSSTSAISTNVWTHVAVTFDNSTNTTKFYICEKNNCVRILSKNTKLQKSKAG